MRAVIFATCAFLAGCATQTASTCVEAPIPTALMQACEKPVVREISTNKDLVALTSDLMEALDACAARVDAIRNYYLGDKK